MVKYVLKYFPIRGRAEVTRLIFAHAGVEYEDRRIPSTEWPNHKAGTPSGQMPVLEVDGVPYCQSQAINRFLARKYKLYGKDDKESYFIDMFVDCFEDLGMKYPMFEKDEKKKAELVKEFMDVTVPEGLKVIESLRQRYKCGEEFFVSQVSIADFTFSNFIDFMVAKKPDILCGTPGLEKLYKKVQALPKIAAWVAKRPATEF